MDARAAELEVADGLNGRAEGAFLETIAASDDQGRALLARAAEAGRISARGWTRVLRLARTIADLEGADGVRASMSPKPWPIGGRHTAGESLIPMGRLDRPLSRPG
jgi:predicted ATPase with chaperone activity